MGIFHRRASAQGPSLAPSSLELRNQQGRRGRVSPVLGLVLLSGGLVLHYFYPSLQQPASDDSASIVPGSNFLKTSGEGWEVWNRTAPLKRLSDLECSWTTFRTVDGMESPMCVHLSSEEGVSRTLRKNGRLAHCDALTALYHENYRPPGIHIEIGANIGGCVMQMLLSTNATIIAFEPNPRNYFCLTSTLVKMDKHYRDRVFLFPIALGREASASTINGAKNNQGNSVVGKVIKDPGNPQQAFDEPFPIQVEPLDALLKPLPISLIKMDAQGFECYILEGMEAVMTQVPAVKTELAPRWLKSFEGCSPIILQEKLQFMGFDIYCRGNKIDTPRELGFAEVLAKKPAVAS